MLSTNNESSQEYRRKITKAKRIVRSWEEQYKTEHKVRPDRAAFKASPEEVREAYRIYWNDKMKKGIATNASFDSGKSTASPMSITSVETSPHHSFNSQYSNEPNSATGTQQCWGMHLNASDSNKIISKTKPSEPSLYAKMAANLRNIGCIDKTRKSLKRRSSARNNISEGFDSQSTSKSEDGSFNKRIMSSCKLQDISNNSPNLKKVINSPLLRKEKPTKSPNIHCSRLLGSSYAPSESPVNNVHNHENSVTTSTHPVEDELGLDLNDDLGCKIIDQSQPFKLSTNTRNKNKDLFDLSKTVNCLSAFNQYNKHKTKIPIKQYDKEWVTRCEDLDCEDLNASDSSDSICCASPVKKTELNILKKRVNNSILNSPAKKIKLQLINKYDTQLETYSLPVSCKSKNALGMESLEVSKCKNIPPSYKKTPENTNTLIESEVEHSCLNDKERTVSQGCDSSEESQTVETYDELCEMELKENSVKHKKKYLTKEERFNKKVESGNLNENYVKINIQKKVFVRGKKHFSTKNYKHKEWKRKQAENSDVGSKKFTCFRCGDFGHWASKCPGKFGDQLMPADDLDECDGTFLTLDQAANLSKGVSSNSNVTKLYDDGITTSQIEETDTVESNLDNSDLFSEYDLDGNSIITTLSNVDITDKISSPEISPISTLYPLHDGNVASTPEEVFQTLKLFGHKSFKEGQEKTIMRILSGLSTLIVSSTGSGKSLCYQLPAYLFAKKQKCVALCISPLVSLMEDQVTGLPPCVKAVCLHTQQNAKNREKALDILKSGNVHILIVSPEAITSSHGGGLLGTILKELPAISFACIDEAHCLSQWSHNFRPAYLQVCKILKEKLKVNTILALTATAKHSTALNIADHIGICNIEQGIISGTRIPSNLILSISMGDQRESLILELLNGDRFSDCSSIIIYCTRRDQCDKTAAFLRTKLLNSNNINVKNNHKRGRTVSIDAEAYHAGLSAYRRGQVQKNFMSGKLRIVVATVAFGMGIDKSDIRGIIHYNMPQSIESYVQEIGRAGRDGSDAHGHLFLDPQNGQDVQELKRHIFSSSVDRFTLRKLLTKVLAPCPCGKISTTDCTSSQIKDDRQSDTINETDSYECPHTTRELAIPIASLVTELDMPEENIKTLLCYLELHSKSVLKVGHHVYSTCTLSCYKGPKQLCLVSRKCPPLAAAIALQASEGVDFSKKSSINFPVVEISAVMGWKSSVVKQELKKLEWDFVGGKYKKSGIKVEFSELAFHLEFSEKLSDEDQDELLNYLYTRANKREKDQLKQLLTTYKILRSVAHPTLRLCCDTADLEKSYSLKSQIEEYFSKNYESPLSIVDQLYIRSEIEERVRASVRSVVSTHRDHSWNGRAIARLFHGIGSPNFPAQTWGRVRNLWRLYLDIDFNLLISLSTKELLKLR